MIWICTYLTDKGWLRHFLKIIEIKIWVGYDYIYSWYFNSQTDIILFPIQNDVGLPVCLMINICPVVTSSVPNIDILLSWGWVTANSLWNTYNNPTGPTACVLVEHMLDACSLKCGNCWKNDVMSRGASSKGTPLINKTILRKIE